jgi:hypothetical protein
LISNFTSKKKNNKKKLINLLGEACNAAMEGEKYKICARKYAKLYILSSSIGML